MAESSAPQARKRHLSEKPETSFQQSKKQKVDSKQIFQYPAAFWNHLSQIHLTKDALKELDRRNCEAPLDEGPSKRTVTPISSNTPSGNTKSTRESKNAGPYHQNFEQHLLDFAIYPEEYVPPSGEDPPPPANLEEIQRRLARPRRSLSPSTFTEQDFHKFVKARRHAKRKRQVVASVIPIIEGDIEDPKCQSGGIPFNNLEPLTDGTIVAGNPDIYYGSRPQTLRQQARKDLTKYIEPSIQDILPVAPNFFLHVMGPSGTFEVALRQATYDAALGARGLSRLHAYLQDDYAEDKNAYSIAAIFEGWTLTLYTTSISKSRSQIVHEEYFMHHIGQWALRGGTEAFRQGAAAYRNARDWAKEQREKAIRMANERASEVEAPSTVDPSLTNNTTMDEGSDTSRGSKRRDTDTSNTDPDMPTPSSLHDPKL
ncbi:MAG: hypothetical protein Q9220_005540 [cf. Caloplaca sp. 1 TL-2023]